MPFPAPGYSSAPPLPPSILQRGQDWLLRQWGNRLQDSPWAVQPGLQPIPHQYPQNPYGGMLAPQPVADIYSFTKKGLLGTPGPEMGGRRGMLGGGRYNFRDPASVAQYERDKGLKAGSLKPVEPQAADVMPMRRIDPNEAKFQKALAEHRSTPIPTKQEAMAKYRAAIESIQGQTPAQMARPVREMPVVKMHPSQNLVPAMRKGGAVYYGKMNETHADLYERHQKALKGKFDEGFAYPDGRFLSRKEAMDVARQNQPEMMKKYRGSDPNRLEGIRYLEAQQGPTTAQMARPVKQTPEISAKLAEARWQRRLSKVLANEMKQVKRPEEPRDLSWVKRGHPLPPTPPGQTPLFETWLNKHAGKSWRTTLTPGQLAAMHSTWLKLFGGG